MAHYGNLHIQDGQIGMADRKLGIILTGGTIGAQGDENDVLRVSSLPERRIVSSISSATVEVPLRKLSEDFTPGDWLTIARSVKSLADSQELDAVVILHGTDTLAYSSAGLSFLLADLPIPVVLTGANRPLSEPDSDAATNYFDAVTAALGLPEGVYVSFSGTLNKPSLIHLGTRVRKQRAGGQAFQSIGLEPLARVTEGKLSHLRPIPPRQPLKTTNLSIDESVLFVKLYPGCPLRDFSELVALHSKRVVVIELYPSQTGPGSSSDFSLAAFTTRCIESGAIVVGTIGEGVQRIQATYESTVEFREAGGILLPSILPEVAVVKVMWALGQTYNFDEFKEILFRNIAGELVDRNSRS